MKLSSSGGGLFDGRPVTLTGVWALSFFGLSSLCSRLRWNMFSLWNVCALRVKC